MDNKILTALYRESLEEDIIKEVAALKNIPLRDAMPCTTQATWQSKLNKACTG